MISLTILGEPASKSNSRELKWNFKAKRNFLVKSDKARAYEQAVKLQVKPLPKLLEGELRADIKIYYASQRPDLDESVILDALQGLIYKNDRQVRTKFVDHAIDKANPRAEIVVRPRT